MFRFNNQLILKATRDCNLRCEYCYIKNKDNFKGEMIDFELFKKTIDRIAKEKVGSKELFSLIFHGGEPTLTPKPLMIKMLIYAENKFQNSGINYSFGMQSNLTLIDEEWCQILSKYNIYLGCSFDGVGKNSNKKRTVKEETFYNKFDLFKKYNVNFGFLTVAHEGNIDNIIESANFLRDEYDIQQHKVNYVEDINGIGGEIPGKEFFDKSWKLFLDEWIDPNNDQKHLRESNCQHLVSKFYSDYLTYYKPTERSNCGSKICGGGTSIIEMEADGSIQFCGRYSELKKESFIMNVVDNDFLSLKQLKRYTDFIYEKHKVILNVGCDTCIADGICDHGCMAFYFSKFGEWGIRTDLTCDIHKSFYEYGVEHIVDMLVATFNEGDEGGDVILSLSNKIYGLKSNIATYYKELKDKHGLKIEINKNNDRQLIIKRI